MTNRIKQEHIKVTLPADLYSQLVSKSIEVLGEVNLSQYVRTLIRKDLNKKTNQQISNDYWEGTR
tara:strand:+ start:404 stop:598 length:195 start_codon:yes stop_codon:yes gene_type:complete